MAVPVRVTESTSFRGSRNPAVPKRRGVVNPSTSQPREPIPPKRPRKRARAHRTLDHQGQARGFPSSQAGVVLPDDKSLGERSRPSTAAVLCKRGVRSPVTLDLSSPRHTSLWSVDVVSEVDPGPGQEALLGHVGAAERPRQEGALRRSPCPEPGPQGLVHSSSLPHHAAQCQPPKQACLPRSVPWPKGFA